MEEQDASASPRNNLPGTKPKLLCSARAVVAFACFLAVFNQTYIRIGVSFVMVCMVNIPVRDNQENGDGCPALVEDAEGEDLFEFDWPSSVRGYLISGAFYGYLFGPFVSGYLSFRYGGKIILITGTVVSGLTHAFIPVGIRKDVRFFFGIRIVTGFFSGFILPAFYDILGRWAVPEERQYLVAGALVGVPMACILNFPVNGFWCAYHGWASTFYFSTAWMIFCGIGFFFSIYDHPHQFPRISTKEFAFLQSNAITRPSDLVIPWCKILRSVPVYAYVITHFCINFGYLTILLSLPTFMRDVHHFNLRSNGMFSALPFVGSVAGRILTTLYFEKFRVGLGLSKTFLRKVFVLTGLVIVSLTLLSITFVTCKYRDYVLFLFMLSQFALEFSLTGGYLLSLMEMCPTYCNIVSGMANTVANVAGLLSPLITGFFTPDGLAQQWNVVFYLVVCVFQVAMITYMVFGTSELQPWDSLANMNMM